MIDPPASAAGAQSEQAELSPAENETAPIGNAALLNTGEEVD
jgi:hypothetical protein